MEKRIFIAVLISIAFLWIWAAVAPKLFPDLVKPVAKPAVTSTSGTSSTTASSGATTSAGASAATGAAPVTNPSAPAAVGTATLAANAPTATVAADAVKLTTIDNDEFTAVFSNRGAQLISFQLKHYPRKPADKKDASLVELVKARDPHRIDFPFAIESADANFVRSVNSALFSVSEQTQGDVTTLQYRWAQGGVSVTKTFRIGNQFLFDFSASVTPPIPYRVAIGPGIRTLDPEEKDSQFVFTGNGVVQRDDKLTVLRREKGDHVNVYDSVQFIGVEDNYFLTALRPTKGSGAVLHAVDFPPIDPKSKDKRRELYAGISAGRDGVVAGEAFFGPKKTSLLDQYGLEKTLQFGMFGIIGRFLLTVLVWINRTTHNYGWAIIVLTIIIKIVLYPLQHKSIVSMKKMQRLQPKMEAIKNRYKKAKTDLQQRQKMNEEMMKLYQVEGINPMSGCLPMVLQLPILWGFYGLLSRAIELRGAPFLLWIQDLSAKDPFYITPILMTATMFIQQWITPSTVDPAQRRMFLIMPLVFGMIFKEFPSGLVLYWLVQNILTIVQQLIMNKYWKDHPTELQTA